MATARSTLPVFRPCPCGSELPREEQHDARGIFLTFTCDKCHAEKMRRYRPDILRDPAYDADEPIEED